MRVFQNLEITEKTGHGTVKIISAYDKEAFDIKDGLIQVTIPFSKKVMKNRGTINGTLKNDNLTDNELTLLGILLFNPSISLSDVCDKMGISRRTISRIVASLQDKGIVERKESTEYFGVLTHGCIMDDFFVFIALTRSDLKFACDAG